MEQEKQAQKREKIFQVAGHGGASRQININER